MSATGVVVRLGGAGEIDEAMAVYERSNFARRQGLWPDRPARVEHVGAHLRDPDTWFLVAYAQAELVGMASAKPLRGENGAGPVIPGGCFLGYLYVLPERWGQGIGGLILEAFFAEANRRHYSRIHLWTHDDNERSQRLYRSAGFVPTGRTTQGEGEWACEI